MQKCDQSELVFTPYITLKNGQRLYARQLVRRYFAFRVKNLRTKIPKKTNS